MRLALRMGRTLAELLASMSSVEFSYWIAFDKMEPIGGDAEDYRAALAAAVVWNVNRGDGTPARAPLDFIPWSERNQTRVIVLDNDDEAIKAFDRTIGLH